MLNNSIVKKDKIPPVTAKTVDNTVPFVNDTDITDLVNDLKQGTAAHITPSIPEGTTLTTKDEIQSYVTKSYTQLTEMALNVLARAQATAVASGTPDDFTAFSMLLGKVSENIDKLNKIAMQDKSIDANKDIKLLEVTGNKAMVDTMVQAKVQLTREELFAKSLAKKEANKIPIDITDVAHLDTETK